MPLWSVPYPTASTPWSRAVPHSASNTPPAYSWKARCRAGREGQHEGGEAVRLGARVGLQQASGRRYKSQPGKAICHKPGLPCTASMPARLAAPNPSASHPAPFMHPQHAHLVCLDGHRHGLVGHRLEQRLLVVGRHVLVVVNGHHVAPQLVVLALALLRLTGGKSGVGGGG